MILDIVSHGAAFVLPPFVVLFNQCILNRIWSDKSPQLLTILSMVLGYPLYFWIIAYLPFQEKSSLFYAYFFFLYSFSAYTYFHVFNMSETSRRIRMLFAIAKKNIHDIGELETIYDDREMIHTRLNRLVALGQIRESAGLYFPKGRLFPITARLLYGLSCLLNMPWPPMKKYLEARDAR